MDRNGQLLHLPPFINFAYEKLTRPSCMSKRNRKIFYHSCYEKYHIYPKFQLIIYQLGTVAKNYDATTSEERAMVPEISYKTLKRI